VGIAYVAVPAADVASKTAGALAPAPGVRIVEVPAARTPLRAAHRELRHAIAAAVTEAVVHGV
ncbi:MAG: hypothetical protein L0H84_22860, partial [Pseudonocardia sp.]|nr:hypothetical protein [Pseudonocardia sp.]